LCPGRITNSGVQEATGSVCAESPPRLDPANLRVEAPAEPWQPFAARGTGMLAQSQVCPWVRPCLSL